MSFNSFIRIYCLKSLLKFQGPFLVCRCLIFKVHPALPICERSYIITLLYSKVNKKFCINSSFLKPLRAFPKSKVKPHLLQMGFLSFQYLVLCKITTLYINVLFIIRVIPYFTSNTVGVMPFSPNV